ncbi:MAG TPA: hypothetical protein VK445_01475 [Dissulfurispiraceae bacterium]|nr:hypothetical protein [Dissulfurispiraceae bacterium]
MLMTDDEAHSKKCILLFQSALSNHTLVDAGGRMKRSVWDGCKCIGSSCMTGWRWAEPAGEHRRGYCGFASRPEF